MISTHVTNLVTVHFVFASITRAIGSDAIDRSKTNYNSVTIKCNVKYINRSTVYETAIFPIFRVHLCVHLYLGGHTKCIGSHTSNDIQKISLPTTKTCRLNVLFLPTIKCVPWQIWLRRAYVLLLNFCNIITVIIIIKMQEVYALLYNVYNDNCNSSHYESFYTRKV